MGLLTQAREAISSTDVQQLRATLRAGHPHACLPVVVGHAVNARPAGKG